MAYTKDLAFMITYYYFVTYTIVKERIDEVLAQVNLLDDKSISKETIKGNEARYTSKSNSS